MEMGKNKKMEQMNFEEMFADFFSAGEKKEKKSEAKPKKAEGAKSEKKVEEKPTGDKEVKLPVIVKARGFSVTVIEGANKLSEIYKKLTEKYPQLQLSGFGLHYVEATNTIYVTEDLTAATPTSVAYDEEVEGPEVNVVIQICDGERVCELTVEDFPGKEADEISVEDVTKYWCKVNTDYEGCQLAYNPKLKIGYPIFNSYKLPEGEENITYTFAGEQANVEVGDSKTGSALALKALGEIPGAKLEMGFAKNANYLFVRKGKGTFTPGGTVSSNASTKTAEQKYKLPMTLYCVTWNTKYELTSDMFGGKEKVTKDMITKEMAKIERVFGDKDRKVDYLYNEEKSLMSCMFISGKKGVR